MRLLVNMYCDIQKQYVIFSWHVWALRLKKNIRLQNRKSVQYANAGLDRSTVPPLDQASSQGRSKRKISGEGFLFGMYMCSSLWGFHPTLLKGAGNARTLFCNRKLEAQRENVNVNLRKTARREQFRNWNLKWSRSLKKPPRKCVNLLNLETSAD